VLDQGTIEEFVHIPIWGGENLPFESRYASCLRGHARGVLEGDGRMKDAAGRQLRAYEPHSWGWIRGERRSSNWNRMF